MKRFLLLICITLQSLFSSAQTTYGIQFSDAIISRWPNGIDAMTFNGISSKGWEYSNSIVLLGMANIYDKTNDADYLTYIKTYVDGYIGTDGTGISSSLVQNLDKIHPGMLCLWLYEKTGTQKYKTAATTIRNYLLKTGFGAYPRTPEKGFWHKNNGAYNNTMMCDGIYMASPFLAKYGALFNDTTATDEAAFQTMTLYSHVYNASNKLVYHAWNYDKNTNWSNATTGVSSQVWSRGMGWYMMALVDILEYLPKTHARYTEMKTALQNLCEGLKNYQDSNTGLWYQVVQNPTGAGNWIETSGSGMFIYAMKKAINNGLIDSVIYTPVVNNAWTGLKTYVTTYTDNKPQITSFAPAMGVLATYDNYAVTLPVSCPGSPHPHGYCAILMASVLMEYPSLGTANFEKSNGLQLFNTETQLNITIIDGKSDSTAIKIYDIKGENIISTTATEQNISINIASLPQGVYVCAIERAGKTASEKFIKN
ncbi:MAG TPA: glycoside hydrolase family 88 protein [Flavobacterium sp.]